MQDTFDEIASSILVSDAELALTFIDLAFSRPKGERQAMAFPHAARAYRSICVSM